jgi:hypothetical protein
MFLFVGVVVIVGGSRLDRGIVFGPLGREIVVFECVTIIRSPRVVGILRRRGFIWRNIRGLSIFRLCSVVTLSRCRLGFCGWIQGSFVRDTLDKLTTIIIIYVM